MSPRLPAVHRFLSDPRISAYEPTAGREHLKQAVALTLDDARRASVDGATFETLVERVIERLRERELDGFVPVINGTGILLHTNLGRAPIADAAMGAMQNVARGYSNLEYDLRAGERSSRYSHAVDLIREVSGAQDTLVVNNCAAAVLLILDTFAKGREVVVARNQLIEIGGGFRLPEVLERSGARLVEAGASNKVYVRDFEAALSPGTALLMRAHRSNYMLSGFTQDVDPPELVALGRRAGIPVVEDLGSGAVCDLSEYGLPRERTVQDAISEGIDLVTFSGDKLLGGPQAGIIAGSRVLVARLRTNPLLRALRIDKLTLAALTETLRLWQRPGRRSEIPLVAMLAAGLDSLRERAQRYRAVHRDLEIIETTAYVGAGALPQTGLPSIALALAPSGGAEAASAKLRRNTPAIVGRIEDNRLVLDLRTIRPAEDSLVVAALHTL